MRLIYSFRRLVFTQVLLGIVSFCIAEQNPGVLLVAGSLGALSWYVTEGPSGRPLPRWLINLAALAAVAWLMLDLFRWQKGNVVVAMGHFTMWLQILLLYTEKSNREYGQLLVLSLMQIIGASALSVSIIYGALLAVYCVVGLLTVLQFHLKATWDRVYEASRNACPQPELVSRPPPVVGHGHRWHLRIMVVVIGLVCAVIAAAVFVATPRNADRRLPAQITGPLARAQVGFNDRISLTTGLLGGESNEPVLNFAVRFGQSNMGGEGHSWLLRGAALDSYDPATHTWLRGHHLGPGHTLRIGADGVTLARLEDSVATYEGRITLRRTGHPALFAPMSVTHVRSANLSAVTFNPVDQKIATVGAGAAIYTLKWPPYPPGDLADRYAAQLSGIKPPPAETGTVSPTYARSWRVEAPRVSDYAMRVLRHHGLDRDPRSPFDPRDRKIAEALAQHLRDNFAYDLENPPTGGLDEPVLEFLFNHRRGHCELFASALAAMARSIGMQARVVTGYRASEYNRIGAYYVVRQNNAHAWTEVNCGPGVGWRVFDSTPPEAVRAEHSVHRTPLTSIRELYEHLEFKWISSVVAYDTRSRKALLQQINRSIVSAANDKESWLGKVAATFGKLQRLWRFERVSYTLAIIIIVTIGVAIGSLLRTMALHRRRLGSLQLAALPRSRRHRLAHNLRFYVAMLDLLERHGIVRPPWQSPLSFARELAHDKPHRFNPVLTLTQLFYEIRFGHRDLDHPRRDQIRANLRQLAQALAIR